MKRKPNLPPLSDGQLEIMTIVWNRGSASVADVWRELSQRREVARNTVLTMLRRLEEKGYLRHRTVGNAFLYSATTERDKTVRGLLRSLLNGAFEGSTEGLVMALLEEAPPNDEEIERIRHMLNAVRRHDFEET